MNSNTSAHNTFEPHRDIETELKRRFTQTIADKLQRACAEKSFDRLVLVAPAKMLGELKEQLPADVQKKVAAMLPKELTPYQGIDLMNHLRDTLAEASGANHLK